MAMRKSALLALASCVGGLAVLLWPLVAQHIPGPFDGGGGPTLASVEEAQRQVDYPLWAPRVVPGGGTFIGAVVSRPKYLGLDEARARARTEHWYETGYGLQIVPMEVGLNDYIAVYGTPGSSAERAGMTRPAPLLALGGRPVVGRSLQAMIAAEAHAKSGLAVTFQAAGGMVRTIVLKRERFLAHPGMPHVYSGRLAALDFHIRGRSLDLQEWPLGDGPPAPRESRRRVSVGGVQVLLAESAQGPVACWSRGATWLMLDNLGGTLSEREELRLIESMYPVQSRTSG